MAKPEERRVPDERGARAEAAGRSKARGFCRRGDGRCRASGIPTGRDPAVSTCAEADEREVEGATFFANTACRWFPCHETADPERFNCLFCFCPLYPLGEACGGDFAYTPSGVKDCSACLLPHRGSEAEAPSCCSAADELAALAKRPQ